jgi:hypothetical protein
MNPDCLDLLRAFAERAVRYLVVGAYALAHHGRPRAPHRREPRRTRDRTARRLLGHGQVKVRDGQLVKAWNCFEFLSTYQQLGWVHDPMTPL